MSDISETKDIKLKSVKENFMDTQLYLRQQLQSECFNKDFSSKHWEKTLKVVDADIGPKGVFRKNLLKTAFKIIIKHLCPEQPSFFGYMCEEESTATNRDFGFMKKLTIQQREHYIEEKGFKGIDKIIAICELSDKEKGNHGGMLMKYQQTHSFKILYS